MTDELDVTIEDITLDELRDEYFSSYAEKVQGTTTRKDQIAMNGFMYNTESARDAYNIVQEASQREGTKLTISIHDDRGSLIAVPFNPGRTLDSIGAHHFVDTWDIRDAQDLEKAIREITPIDIGKIDWYQITEWEH
jgi:U3 small nucleolar ribonucleoprotein component